MSKKKGNGLIAVLIVLVLALLAVVGVIVFKQIEYGENEAFHESLRGMSMADIKQTQPPISHEGAGITQMPEFYVNESAVTEVPVTTAPTAAETDISDGNTDAEVSRISAESPTGTNVSLNSTPTAAPAVEPTSRADAPVTEMPEPTPLPPIDSETAHSLMRQMFLAAAGTTIEQEQALWKQYEEEEAAAKLAAEASAVHSDAPTAESESTERSAEQTAVPEPTAEILSEQISGQISEPMPSPVPTERPLTKKEKIARRQEELRLNRENTLIWLTEALTPREEVLPTPSPKPTATPNPNMTPDPNAVPEPPVWTIEDAYAQFGQTETGREYIRMLSGLGACNAEDAMILMREACAQWMSEIDAEKLRAINSDYACWIYCADTQIDYPVVHGEDNEYYVDHMFNKKRNAAGALFIDRRNLPCFQDPNTLIYGHNMRNDSMFGILNNYEIDGYFEVHPYFLIVSEREIALIEIFAGYTTSKYDHCYDIALSDSDDMLAFVREAQRKSDFDTTVEIRSGDRLVTLSTCAYAFENARYIVIGRLGSLWKR